MYFRKKSIDKTVRIVNKPIKTYICQRLVPYRLLVRIETYLARKLYTPLEEWE